MVCDGFKLEPHSLYSVSSGSASATLRVSSLVFTKQSLSFLFVQKAPAPAFVSFSNPFVGPKTKVGWVVTSSSRSIFQSVMVKLSGGVFLDIGFLPAYMYESIVGVLTAEALTKCV